MTFSQFCFAQVFFIIGTYVGHYLTEDQLFYVLATITSILAIFFILDGFIKK